MADTIRVSDGDTGGRNGLVAIPSGFTVGDYFRKQKGGADLGKYRVTVNSKLADAGTVLTGGDVLAISLAKYAGAAKSGARVR